MANQYTHPAKQLLHEWLERNPTGWLLYTPDEIAEDIGVSRASVYNWINRFLAKIHGTSPDAFKRIRLLQSTVTDYTRKKIVQRLKEGYDIFDTAHHFGLHPWNVHVVECTLNEESKEV